MQRTAVMLTDDLNGRLRFEARRRGVSIADVAREVIAAYPPEPADADLVARVITGFIPGGRPAPDPR